LPLDNERRVSCVSRYYALFLLLGIRYAT